MAQTDVVALPYPTLAEVAHRADPDGNTPYIANVLEKKNPFLQDIPWFEGNRTTGHEITHTATALPTPSFRTINDGVVPTKGKTQKYLETCALIEDHSMIDEALVKLNGGRAWRESEDMIKLQAIPQYFATEVFYESVSTNPERFHGLAPRYPASSGYTSSSYVIVGANAGDGSVNFRSVWLITWEERKIYGIYPQGTKAGLERNDKGLERVVTSSTTGASLYMWVTQFLWWCGIAVEDYRYAVRLQWDPDDPEMAVTEKGLILAILDMFDVIYEVTPNTRLYMDRTTLRRFNAQLANSTYNLLEWMTLHNGKLMGDSMVQGGERVRVINGTPMRIADALVAETAIS